MEALKDTELAELSLLHGLSVRAVHVCEGADLKRLSEIRAFHQRHGGFAKLPNCGAKTVLELETLLANSVELSERAGYAPAKQLPEGVAQRIYEGHLGKLTSAARHELSAVLNGPNGRSGISFFLRHGERPPQLIALKGHCRRELLRMSAALFKDLEDARRDIGQEVEETAGKELYRWAVQYCVSASQLKELFDSEGRMTVLHFLEGYLRDLDRRTPHRIMLAYLGSGGDPASMADLAKRFGVTSEYVRQVLAAGRLRSARLFRPMAALPGMGAHYPELHPSAPVYMMEPQVLERMNSRERTHWSALFILHLMQAISEEGHVLGSWTSLFGKSHWAKELDAQQPFLIKRSTMAPLSSLLKEIQRQYEQVRKVPKQAELTVLLDAEEPSMRRCLLDALKVLAGICFPAIVVMEDRFMLPSNKTHFNEDRLVEVLEKLDIPSHISAVREVWNNSYPDRPISLGSIRSLVSAHRNVFMSIGRSSIYGLKRWEEERPWLKAGTIRNIIAEQLSQVDSPLHVEDLLPAVKKYRPDATMKNILQNLRLAREFKIYPGGYVGLASKAYVRIPDPVMNVPGSLMRELVLRRFIDRPRNELSTFLASKCTASPARIASTIDDAVAKGRLHIDASGIIRQVPRDRDGSAPGFSDVPASG